MTEWRDIPGYEGYYQVSDDGRVRSLTRTISHSRRGSHHIPGQAMRQHRGTNGRLSVVLSRDNTKRTIHIHRLVAEAFLGDLHFDGSQVCHNDGDADNNHVLNLRWDTGSANQLDAVKHGANTWARRTRCANDHPFSPENTRIDGRTGRRLCRSCDRDRQREYKLRRRALQGQSA